MHLTPTHFLPTSDSGNAPPSHFPYLVPLILQASAAVHLL